jgi:HEPN domain-containing protein
MNGVFMKKTLIFLSGAALLAVLLCISCARPPTEEMNRAVEAISRAENDADAVTYAGNILSRARDALTKMQEEANLKRFDSAKLFAAEAVSLSERAVTEGKANAARAREEAANLLGSLGRPIAETESALNEAKGHDIDIDYDALGATLNAAKTTFDSAQSSLEEGDFPDAIEKGQMARSVISDINDKINEGAQVLLGKK